MPEEPLEAMCRRIVCVLEDASRTLDGATSAVTINAYHVADLLILRDRARLLADRATNAAIKAGELNHA